MNVLNELVSEIHDQVTKFFLLIFVTSWVQRKKVNFEPEQI